MTKWGDYRKQRPECPPPLSIHKSSPQLLTSLMISGLREPSRIKQVAEKGKTCRQLPSSSCHEEVGNKAKTEENLTGKPGEKKRKLA